MSRRKRSPEDPAKIGLSTVGNLLEEESSSKEVFRSQQSLGLITQRFMSLRQKNEIMNLNAVAKELNIPKRRVYDVINVLEGLGYVQKIEKNNIQWIGEATRSEEQNHLEATVEMMRQQEKILEMMIQDAQAIIGMHFEDPIARPYNYIRKDDIRSTADANSKSIIIKSDNDVDNHFEVQVTDPAASGCYDMIVKNKSGVKSHALLFNNEQPRGMDDEEKPEKEQLLSQDHDLSLTDSPSKSKEIKLEPVDLDPEDDEEFVLPSFSANSANTPYVPETPGRGLFLSPYSPLRALFSPSIMPMYSSDLINISTPSEVVAETMRRDEPASIMDFFNDMK
ncbi:hypothetical protein L5515_014998 [Caenorhabditis briggsae]|uniref:E2F/DP family winged-helix DNA-binding domain-containing protein n=2 Tax=Caenorhabditis briggsae TaxID=6238 RepID=A0AAE9J7L4_CAEBR|nr:hypothetical protein L5515_014998 [Caenorhabditis briggsae]